MVDAPERIWVDFDYQIWETEYSNSIGYIRADLYEQVKRERDEAVARADRQKAAGFCDAFNLTDGEPVKCGWQRRAEALSRTGAVKVLEWSTNWGAIKAETPIGQYFIKARWDGSFDCRLENIWKTWASSSDAAKAAAQADYERRILSALAEPAGEAEPLSAQIERLASFIMEHVPGEPSQSEGAVDCAIRIIRNSLTTPPASAIREAAKRVIWFDWSENDPDAVAAIDGLRAALAGSAE